MIENLVAIATLDLLPTDLIYENTVDLPEEEEDDLDDEFLSSGYESHYFVLNAGSLFLFFIVLGLIGFSLLLFYPCSRYSRRCHRQRTKVKRWLMFNPILRFLLEACLDFSCGIFIQQVTLNQDHEAKESSSFITFNNYMLLLFLILIASMPIAISVFLCLKFKHLQDQSFEDKYGALYSGLDITKRSSLLF